MRFSYLAAILIVGAAFVGLKPQSISAQTNRDDVQRAITKPLPSRFFSEQTLMLARLEVASMNVENFYKAMGALIPKDVTAKLDVAMRKSMTGGEPPSGSLAAMGTIRRLVDNPQMLAQMRKQNPSHPLNLIDVATKKLLAADIDALYVVLMQSSGSSSPSPFFMIPQKGIGTRVKNQERSKAFNEVAKLVNAKVVADEGWWVAGMQNLPEPGDEFGLDDAAFLDALQSNPMHDLMVAFVPPLEMRTTAKKEWEEMIKNTPANERQLVPMAKQLGQSLEGDWFYASVQFGPKPAIRVSAHFANSTQPKSLATNLNRFLDTMPNIVPEKKSSSPTIQQIRASNNKTQFEMIQMIRFSSNGTFLTCDLDSETLSRMLKKSLEMRTEPADNSPQSIDPTSGFGK